MKDYRLFSIIATLVMIIACLAAIFSLEESERTLLNFITIVGTALSIIGLIITYLQILSVKQSNKTIGETVNKTIKRLNQVLSVSDLSKSIKNIDEIQGYIRSNDLRLALLRMKDVKSIIISIKYITALNNLTQDSDYSILVQDFSIDLNNINTYNENPAKKIDSKKVISNLENLSTKLSEFENYLKSIQHD